jgi:hypothetical protein
MRTTISIILSALAAWATDASAACQQASLKGNWHYSANAITFNEDGVSLNSAFLEDCTIRITRNGSIRKPNCIGEEDTVLGTTTFTVQPDCGIEARVSEFCDTVVGQISPNKQVVSGAATCCCLADDNGDFLLPYDVSFTLVKRTPAGGNAQVSKVTTTATNTRRASHYGAPTPPQAGN